MLTVTGESLTYESRAKFTTNAKRKRIAGLKTRNGHFVKRSAIFLFGEEINRAMVNKGNKDL